MDEKPRWWDDRLLTKRGRILVALDSWGQPMRPKDIVTLTGIKAGTVAYYLHELTKEGFIDRRGFGRYAIFEEDSP